MKTSLNATVLLTETPNPDLPEARWPSPVFVLMTMAPFEAREP